jgi:hypothetical protein
MNRNRQLLLRYFKEKPERRKLLLKYFNEKKGGQVKKKKKKKKKRERRLPNKLFAIKNPDKLDHEKWYQGRNMLNFPAPFRGVIGGKPGTCKTTNVKHILMRQKPPFDHMIVVHCNPEYTQEYNDVGAKVVGSIPGQDFWNKLEGKKLVVLDDIDFKNIKGEQAHRLNRLYGNWSTHNNISVLLCTQCPFQVPPIVRRCSNIWILSNMDDHDAINAVARKVGIGAPVLNQLYERYIKTDCDSIWIDKTKGTPFPYRYNGFNEIKI